MYILKVLFFNKNDILSLENGEGGKKRPVKSANGKKRPGKKRPRKKVPIHTI